MKISGYAAAKARRLDRIARRFGGSYQSEFVSERAGEYVFDSWYGGEIHIVLPSDSGMEATVPFDAFDPGYEKEYAAYMEAGAE